MRKVIFVKHQDPEVTVRMLNSIIAGSSYGVDDNEIVGEIEVKQEASEESGQFNDKPGLWARIISWFKG